MNKFQEIAARIFEQCNRDKNVSMETKEEVTVIVCNPFQDGTYNRASIIRKEKDNKLCSVVYAIMWGNVIYIGEKDKQDIEQSTTERIDTHLCKIKNRGPWTNIVILYLPRYVRDKNVDKFGRLQLLMEGLFQASVDEYGYTHSHKPISEDTLVVHHQYSGLLVDDYMNPLAEMFAKIIKRLNPSVSEKTHTDVTDVTDVTTVTDVTDVTTVTTPKGVDTNLDKVMDMDKIISSEYPHRLPRSYILVEVKEFLNRLVRGEKVGLQEAIEKGEGIYRCLGRLVCGIRKGKNAGKPGAFDGRCYKSSRAPQGIAHTAAFYSLDKNLPQDEIKQIMSALENDKYFLKNKNTTMGSSVSTLKLQNKPLSKDIDGLTKSIEGMSFTNNEIRSDELASNLGLLYTGSTRTFFSKLKKGGILISTRRGYISKVIPV